MTWVLLSQTLKVELDLTIWKSLSKKHQQRIDNSGSNDSIGCR